MAITVIDRPEKTLENGYLSRWNASRTPLNYKFNSTLFPVNTVDPILVTNFYQYDASERGVLVKYDNHGFSEGWFIQTTVNDEFLNIAKVKRVVNADEFVLDLFITAQPSGNIKVQRYYKGYKGLVKVFAGAPSYHPYNTDLSKPKTEIGTIEVEFDSNNEGIANVRNFIKPDMTADFDYNDDNSHFAWTSFNIEYTEIWDNQETPIPYAVDILENCTPFTGLTNPSFDSGLTDWQLLPADITWTTGTSEIIANGLGGSGQRETDTVTQDIDLRANVPYQIEVNYDLVSGTVSDVYNFVVVAKPVGGTEEAIYTARILELGTGIGLIDYTPTSDIEYIGFKFFPQALFPQTFEFKVQFFQITTSVLDQCEYSSFSVFGAQQFQNALGGNFGDYIADYQVRGKFLTHFSELTYPYYVNSLIPNATFNRSENSDSIFLEELVFDAQGNEKEAVQTKVENKSDGVYTIDSGITIAPSEWKEGVVRLISIPSNLLLDGDGGTYDNATPASWNITPFYYSAGTPNQIGSTVIADSFDSVSYGGLNVSSGNMLVENAPFLSHKFDTPVQVVQGQVYIIESEVRIDAAEFDPFQWKNTSVYLGIEGYNDSDLSIVSLEVPSITDSEPIIIGKLTTSFVPTTDTVNVLLKCSVKQSIVNGTGGVFYLNDTTFKGPIEYLTESKIIKAPTNCSVKYNTLLRWKNDLGGWDLWNFNRYRTFNETVSNRNEIRRDVTENFDDYFINGDTEYDTINMDVRKSVTLRSGLLTQEQQVILNQIRRSIKIQVQIDGRWVTVTANPSTFLLTDENEYMREVSFDIFLPNTLVQEQ